MTGRVSIRGPERAPGPAPGPECLQRRTSGSGLNLQVGQVPGSEPCASNDLDTARADLVGIDPAAGPCPEDKVDALVARFNDQRRPRGEFHLEASFLGHFPHRCNPGILTAPEQSAR
jgi:hypothetical protein